MTEETSGHGQRWLVIGTIVLVLVVAGGAIAVVAGLRARQPSPESTDTSTETTATAIPLASETSLATTVPTKLSDQPIDNTTLTYTETTVTSDPNAPTLTKASETALLGSSLWLHPVPDGQSSIMISSEPSGTIAMARWDPNAPIKSPSWKTVASKTDAGSNIADHWHVYAHDAHWVAFSISEANKSFLLKVDADLKRQCLVPVVTTAELTDAEQASIAADLPADNPNKGQNQPVATNDMWLVAEPNGVAIGHFVPGYGTKVFRFDTDCQATGTALVGGGNYTHGNGSSAELTETGFLMFAAESLNSVATSAIRLITLDADWQPVSVKILLFEDETNLAMPSSVKLPSGYRVVNLRATADASPRGVLPPPPSKTGGALSDDSGAIVRYVLAPDDTVVERTVLLKDGGNRPHTALFDDLLLTGWDGAGLTLRVDRIGLK